MYQILKFCPELTSHGIPAAHGHQATVLILGNQIVQHGAVIDEGVQIAIQHSGNAIGDTGLIIAAKGRDRDKDKELKIPSWAGKSLLTSSCSSACP